MSNFKLRLAYLPVWITFHDLGLHFNLKMPSYLYRQPHVKEKTSYRPIDFPLYVASRLVAVLCQWAVMNTLVEWLACETAAREVSRSNPGGGQFVSASKIKHHFYMWTSKRKRVLFIVCHFLETAFEKTHPNTWILSWINAQSHRHNNRACLRKNVWAVPWAQTFLSRDTSQLLWLTVIWIIVMFTIDWWNDSPSYVNTNVTWWVGNHLNIY